MVMKFLLPVVIAIGMVIAAGDYHYYRQLHWQYSIDTASLSRTMTTRVMENIPVELHRNFLGLEVMAGRDRDELGIRTSWSRLTGTPELARDTRFDLVFDAKVYEFNGRLFLHMPCFRSIENATEKMRQALPDHERRFLIRHVMGDKDIMLTSPHASARPALAGTRRRVVDRVRVGPDQTVFDTGLPHYRHQAYVPPEGLRDPVGEACQPL